MQTLHRQGLSQCEISALTGYDRKTVRKYLAHATLPQMARVRRVPASWTRLRPASTRG